MTRALGAEDGWGCRATGPAITSIQGPFGIKLRMPDLTVTQWLLGGFCALMIGVTKTGAPGFGMLTLPLMVMTIGDARHAVGWTAPMLITGDIFAVAYWRRHAETRALFSLMPWVVPGMLAGGLALSLSEPIIRRGLGFIVLTMLALNLVRRWKPDVRLGGHPYVLWHRRRFCQHGRHVRGPCDEHVPAQKASAQRAVRGHRRVVLLHGEPREAADLLVPAARQPPVSPV